MSYPLWYDIPGIEYISRGQQDAQLIYKGRLIDSAAVIENSMWVVYQDSVHKGLELDFDSFMIANQEHVRYLCEEYLGLIDHSTPKRGSDFP